MVVFELCFCLGVLRYIVLGFLFTGLVWVGCGRGVCGVSAMTGLLCWVS